MMGFVHIQELEKPTPDLGKKWWEQGETGKQNGFTYKLLCQILCHSLLLFPDLSTIPAAMISNF